MVTDAPLVADDFLRWAQVGNGGGLAEEGHLDGGSPRWVVKVGCMPLMGVIMVGRLEWAWSDDSPGKLSRALLAHDDAGVSRAGQTLCCCRCCCSCFCCSYYCSYCFCYSSCCCSCCRCLSPCCSAVSPYPLNIFNSLHHRDILISHLAYSGFILTFVRIIFIVLTLLTFLIFSSFTQYLSFSSYKFEITLILRLSRVSSLCNCAVLM